MAEPSSSAERSSRRSARRFAPTCERVGLRRPECRQRALHVVAYDILDREQERGLLQGQPASACYWRLAESSIHVLRDVHVPRRVGHEHAESEVERSRRCFGERVAPRCFTKRIRWREREERGANAMRQQPSIVVIADRVDSEGRAPFVYSDELDVGPIR